ncbi:MAG TPA: radical SAM protein [Nitrospirota bacterium]|nr:radical SAM protein [Nitrospirota bacterium]
MKAGPAYIQFYPTLRCNKACDFCFNRSMPFAEDMALSDFLKMLEVLERTPVETIDIIGGEPTLHPDIVSFIARARDRGFSVNISTNGTNPAVLGEIMKIGKAVTVGISINDRETLTQVRGFIHRHKPVVKTVYSPGMDRGMIGEILSLGPERFYLIYRDALDARELDATVPFREFKYGIERAFDHQQVGMVYCAGFLPDSERYPELANVRCPSGTTKLGVMPDGSVYPCNLLFGRKEFLLGNILTDPFTGIWHHGRLNFFRTASGNACPDKSCTLHSKCHGGCPAHGLFITGDLAAPDPRCVAAARLKSLL